MSLSRRLGPLATSVLTSPRTRNLRRGLAEWRRRLSRQPHRVFYFHQLDDPYSHLAAQVLAPFVERYEVELVPMLVGPPPAAAAPERERLVAFSRKDAADIAPDHGLEFRDPGEQPESGLLSLAGADPRRGAGRGGLCLACGSRRASTLERRRERPRSARTRTSPRRRVQRAKRDRGGRRAAPPSRPLPRGYLLLRRRVVLGDRSPALPGAAARRSRRAQSRRARCARRGSRAEERGRADLGGIGAQRSSSLPPCAAPTRPSPSRASTTSPGAPV